jgi:hypothetical protein
MDGPSSVADLLARPSRIRKQQERETVQQAQG